MSSSARFLQHPPPDSRVDGDDLPEGLLDATLSQLAHVCGADGAAMHLVQPDGAIVLAARMNHILPDAVLARGIDRVLDYGALLSLSEDELLPTRSYADAPEDQAAKCYAGIPVGRGSSMVGVLSIMANRTLSLTEAARRAMELAARHIATEFELAALRRQRDLFPAIIDSLPGVFYILDEDGRLLRWNRHLAELAGLDEASLRRVDPLDLFAAEDRAVVKAQRDRTFECGQADCEAGVVTKDGRILPYYFTGHRITIEGRPCIIGMGLDFSARRAAEEERDRLFDLSPDPLCICSFEGHFEDLNPAWERAIGVDKRALLGRPVLDLIHPEDKVAMQTAMEAAGSESTYVETRLRTRAAQWRCFAWHIRAESERGLRYAVARDVTAPRAVAAALETSEARYRSLVESARDAIAVILPDGRIDSVNGAFSETVGWDADEWVGRNLAELVYDEDLPRALQALSGLDNENRMPVFELRVRAKDGIPVPVEIQGTQIRLEDGTIGALVIARDVRERKALDQRLQRVQRLDAIGQLAAGVAHDFNNLLQIIHGEVDLLLTHPLITTQVRDALQNVAEASTRAQRITRKLLLLSREHEWQAEAVDLNETVSRFLPMLRRLLGSHHRVDWQPAAALPTIRGDLGMLEQVLMNLMINARDAMPEGGTVHLGTRVIQVDDERAVREPDARSGAYVELAVRDTGTGISPEHLPHIFEPLFTTKPVGEGTGLGLATIYGIVRRHEGWIDVASESGAGATFLLHFPVPDPVPDPVPRSGSEPRDETTIRR